MFNRNKYYEDNKCRRHFLVDENPEKEIEISSFQIEYQIICIFLYTLNNILRSS